MFFPLHDGVPLRSVKAPFVGWGIIALCSVLHLASVGGLLPPVEPLLAAGFGIIPKVVLGDAFLPSDLVQAPPWLSPVTSLFLHGGFAHLIGNMLFLWVFGDNVEDMMGHVRFVIFFLLCGILAAFAHAAMNPQSIQPLIGASGAISGVVAAYLLLFPKERIFGLVLKFVPVTVPAWVAIGAWIAFQIVQAFWGGVAAVAWFAHLGGLLAGVALTPFLVRPGVSIRA
ncbi:MAG: rhomboid family intramembrane serine protease, partial [Hyphomicrobiales bacterium]|nr:rhomboid family intramembrane serine protease [Hyphomicrobiales bacterium]